MVRMVTLRSDGVIPCYCYCDSSSKTRMENRKNELFITSTLLEVRPQLLRLVVCP